MQCTRDRNNNVCALQTKKVDKSVIYTYMCITCIQIYVKEIASTFIIELEAKYVNMKTTSFVNVGCLNLPYFEYF